eukprot:9204383-Alexandrium_andersonii.AAC.1
MGLSASGNHVGSDASASRRAGRAAGERRAGRGGWRHWWPGAAGDLPALRPNMLAALRALQRLLSPRGA